MENSREFSDEEWVASPLICGALSNIPVDIRWEIWEHQTLTDKEKVPIYKYWAEQFSGDPVTDEEIEVSGDVLTFPDEKDFYKMNPEDTDSYVVPVYFPFEPNDKPFVWRPSTLLKVISLQVTGYGDGFILYGEPYTPLK
jgi:hypothetical protein